MPSSFVDSRINQNLEVATEYFRALMSYKDGDKVAAGSIGFLPFNVNFTMDGIGGIKIYNELSVDTSFLPPGYTKTTDFIVTGVDHKISNGDWETNITTTLIPRTSTINNTITGSLQIFGQVETAPLPPAPPANQVVTGAVNTDASEGSPTGVYISPARKADKADGTNYVDVSKTLANKTLASLAQINGGLYPIKFYTKPGDTSGIKYAKVVGFNGLRNEYEQNPTFFTNNVVSWSYKGSKGFNQSARVNKAWVPTLTQIAQLLDSKGMWNSTHIISWGAGIILRDVNPAGGVAYGQISAHAFGMAIDINSGQYPLKEPGVLKWEADFAARIPTALVHNEINENFVKVQGGTNPVFWLKDSNDAHHFSVYKKV